jgi:hypothetical protein
MNGETRTGWCACELLAKACVAEFAFVDGRHGLLDGFAFFAAELLSGESHTFAFVGLRWVIGTDIGGALTNHLVVNALDGEFGVIGDGDFHTFRDIEMDGMGFPEAQIQEFALDSGLETDAMDFHVALESIGDSRDHVRKQGAGESVESFVFALLTGALDGEDFAIDFRRNTCREFPLEFSLRAFDEHRAIAVDGYFDLWWDRDGFFTDS